MKKWLREYRGYEAQESLMKAEDVASLHHDDGIDVEFEEWHGLYQWRNDTEEEFDRFK
jgi:hypothetical protein